MYGDLMAIKFNSVGHPEDVVKIDEIFRRYIEINGTIDGFEEYVKSGFRNGNEIEYEEYVNNELYVSMESSGYMYFKTRKKNCSDAVEDFWRAMKSVGINFDNYYPSRYELRDENGNNIDSKED